MSEAERSRLAIAEIENALKNTYRGIYWITRTRDGLSEETLNEALSAIRAQDQNEPLMLEQLSRMSRADWVWVVFPELEREEDMWSRATDMYTFYSHENYGKTWIAYVHEPKGAGR